MERPNPVAVRLSASVQRLARWRRSRSRCTGSTDRGVGRVAYPRPAGAKTPQRRRVGPRIAGRPHRGGTASALAGGGGTGDSSAGRAAAGLSRCSGRLEAIERLAGRSEGLGGGELAEFLNHALDRQTDDFLARLDAGLAGIGTNAAVGKAAAVIGGTMKPPDRRPISFTRTPAPRRRWSISTSSGPTAPCTAPSR